MILYIDGSKTDQLTLALAESGKPVRKSTTNIAFQDSVTDSIQIIADEMVTAAITLFKDGSLTYSKASSPISLIILNKGPGDDTGILLAIACAKAISYIYGTEVRYIPGQDVNKKLDKLDTLQHQVMKPVTEKYATQTVELQVFLSSIGFIAMEEELYGLAEACLLKLLSCSDEDEVKLEATAGLAAISFEAKDYVTCANFCAEVISRDSDNASILYRLAICKIKLGALDDAVAAVKSLSKIDKEMLKAVKKTEALRAIWDRV
jgi:tetratricopeptide (TPR) repeat protein